MNDVFSDNTTLMLIEVTFLASALIQLFYYLFFFNKLANYEKKAEAGVENGVSIVIAAKNEAENIKKNIPLILNQEYENFEIIIVNDHSEDETLRELEKITSNRLSYFNLTEGKGKKMALAYGIKKAKHSILLFTDADCIPNSNRWIEEMTSSISSNINIVLGYSSFMKTKGLLNALIRFENLLNAMQYFSYALKGNAYMGVGRNLAYNRSIFEKSSSFQKHASIQSGDDDLLINEMSEPNNVAISIGSDSHTITQAENSWSKYFHQRRRQLVAGEKYKLKHKVLLALFGASNFLYYAMLVSLLVNFTSTPIILGIFVVKQIVEQFVFHSVSKKLKEGDLVIWVSLLEPLYMLTITMIGISTWIWSVKKWK